MKNNVNQIPVLVSKCLRKALKNEELNLEAQLEPIQI